MTDQTILAEWLEGCAKYGIDIERYPTPDKTADLSQELHYELGSFIDVYSDKQIADIVRTTHWLADIAHRWHMAHAVGISG